jgi:ABC-type uncharacterized transport system permease subunit
MLIGTVAAIVSSLLYFYISYILWNKLASTNSASIAWSRSRFLWYVIIAATLQLVSFSGFLVNTQFINLDLSIVLSLITWLSVITLLTTNLKQSTENLGIFIFPFAGLTTILIFLPSETEIITIELASHVLLSIGAYSIMGLASAQAILYSVQEKKFRQKKLTTLFKSLPPLQVMESIMIQFLAIGFILLTLSLITGFIFLEDMFAQHLVHKTFFAILSWLVYGIFLTGHYKFGWRGQIATKFTIWAYFLLVISYIGTQIILMYII